MSDVIDRSSNLALLRSSSVTLAEFETLAKQTMIAQDHVHQSPQKDMASLMTSLIALGSLDPEVGLIYLEKLVAEKGVAWIYDKLSGRSKDDDGHLSALDNKLTRRYMTNSTDECIMEKILELCAMLAREHFLDDETSNQNRKLILSNRLIFSKVGSFKITLLTNSALEHPSSTIYIYKSRPSRIVTNGYISSDMPYDFVWVAQQYCFINNLKFDNIFTVDVTLFLLSIGIPYKMLPAAQRKIVGGYYDELSDCLTALLLGYEALAALSLDYVVVVR
jgi:hypothetical protein